MPFANRTQPLADVGERVFPAHLDEARPFTPHGLAQPIWIFEDVLERQRLRAEVTPAERIITVTPNAQNLSLLVFDRQPADRLAQIARTEVGLRHGLTDLPGGSGGCTPLPDTMR